MLSSRESLCLQDETVSSRCTLSFVIEKIIIGKWSSMEFINSFLKFFITKFGIIVLLFNYYSLDLCVSSHFKKLCTLRIYDFINT